MDQFCLNLQLPKPKNEKLIASAECDQIPKMDQIICFYVNTHVLKSEAGDFVILKHRYSTVTRIKLLCNDKSVQKTLYGRKKIAAIASIVGIYFFA